MRIIYLWFCLGFLFSCSSKTEKKDKENNSVNNNSSNYSDKSESDNENNTENEVRNDIGCKYEDGTYSATVDYNNPQTGYSQTYTLDVEVQNCQVVQIDFPNDGYLDEDHISPASIDESGNALVDGEEGKTYEIQIDN